MILILMISIILVIHRIKKGERVMIDKERKSNPIIISGKEDKECYEIIKNYWGEILIRTKIEYGISDISFETWLQKLQIAEYREGTLVLRFPEDENLIDIPYYEGICQVGMKKNLTLFE